MANHYGPAPAWRDGLIVIDCKACGYAHLESISDPDSLTAYYQNDFWQHTKAGELSQFERAAAWWNAIHGDWLEIVESLTSRRTLLDVGSGYGFFLRAAMARGWTVAGIELNTAAADYAEGQIGKLRIIRSAWSVAQVGLYDCISAHWFIEHIPNPFDFLLWARAHLAPGGVLMIVVPQEWTEAQHKANVIADNKNWFVHPTHINYFSQTSFANLLGRAGFRIIDMLATHSMEEFILEGSDYTSRPDLGRILHERVEKAELSQMQTIRQWAGRIRAQDGRGRDLIVFGMLT